MYNFDTFLLIVNDKFNWSAYCTWTAIDACGNSGSCKHTFAVKDTTPPEIQCNVPDAIIPPDVPISFTATATDNCSSAVSAEILDFDCVADNGKSRRKTCEIEIVRNTITILHSGGVNENIRWMVSATDDCGNSRQSTCSVEVVDSGQSPKPTPIP